MKRRILSFIKTSGEIFDLFRKSIACTFTSPFYVDRLVDQIIRLGVGSIPITIVIGLTIGLVMTLQFGYGLAKFGGTMYVPNVVTLSLTRELAPIMTSILFAGRAGSGIVAEIAAMNVTQQVDAIRALGTSPIRVLVVPRLLASAISLPLLTSLANLLGILGGLLIAVLEFQMTPGFYYAKVVGGLWMIDMLSCVIKPFFFSLIITMFACYKGFKTKDGTTGVGKAATWVVVNSSILILLTDLFMTKLFLAITYIYLK